MGGGWKRGSNSPLPSRIAPPAGVIFQHFVEFGAGGDLDGAFVEFVARAETFGIPRGDLAEHPAAERLAKHFNHQIQMPAHHAHPFGEAGFGQHAIVPEGRVTRVSNVAGGLRILRLAEPAPPNGLQIIQRMLENPRIVKRTAPDAHAGTPVSSSIFFAAGGEMMSPLPMTGIS